MKKIKNIFIKKYRCIEELNIPMFYGSEEHGKCSDSFVIAGSNMSGKTSVLKAIEDICYSGDPEVGTITLEDGRRFPNDCEAPQDILNLFHYMSIRRYPTDDMIPLYHKLGNKAIAALEVIFGKTPRIIDRIEDNIHDGCSNGIKYIYYLIYLLSEIKEGSLILIDEPELHLSSEFHRGLFEGMKIASKDSQLIVTTLSAEIYDMQYSFERIWLVNK